MIVVVCGLALVGPWVAPHDPNRVYEEGLRMDDGTPVGPGSRFVLGTDQLGRDELSRLLDGGRVTLQVATLATALAVIAGLLIGLASGFFGGVVDLVAMRLVDILLSIPFLLIAISVQKALKSTELWSLYLLLGLLSWSSLARITRSKVMQVKELDYVQAARVIGCPNRRIVFAHILPNILGPVIVIATTMVANMVIVESAMSFLGLGVQAPQSSWGTMLRDGQALMTHSPRLVVLPGLLIVCTVFGFNLLGEGLRDALDPKDR